MAVLSEAQQRWMPEAELRRQLVRYALSPSLQVDNAIHATHRSVRRDAGVEFSQFRPFQPGDDLRRVDWRVYGRSDRLLVRESQSEGRLTILLLVDLSGSMGMRDADGISRFEYAAKLIGAVAWLAVEHHHDLMLVGLQSPLPHAVPAGAGRTQLERVARILDTLTPQGAWPSAAVLSESLRHVPARSLVFSFSDHLSEDDGMEAAFGQLSGRGLSITSTQVLLPQELTPPMRGQFRVVECESQAARWFDAGSEAQDYQQRLRQLLADTRRRRVRTGARFIRTATNIDPAETLQAMLAAELAGRERLLVAREHP